MKKFIIPLVILIMAVVEIIALTLGVQNGSIIMSENAYLFAMLAGVLIILVVLYVSIKFAILPKIKYKKVFEQLKQNKENEILDFLKNTKFTSSNNDQYLLLSVISNETIFNDDYFYDIAKQLNNKNYLFAQHFWLALKYFSENNFDFAKEQMNLYHTSPHSFINSNIYQQIIQFLEYKSKDEEFTKRYNYLCKKIKNSVILSIINKKYAQF